MSNKSKSDKSNSPLIKETNFTYDDYASIDDGNFYELSGGQLELMSPAPSVTHQLISFEIQKNISKNCESSYIILSAPIDMILSSNEVRQPDLVLINRNRMDIIRKRGIKGAPDLIVEILSPSTLKRDKIDKLKTYANFHIPEYWIVEPDTGVLEQYILHDDQYNLVDIFQKDNPVTSPNISCISFTMKEVMENIPNLSDE